MRDVRNGAPMWGGDGPMIYAGRAWTAGRLSAQEFFDLAELSACGWQLSGMDRLVLRWKGRGHG